jgi:F-type H+-transporting ATPase subunit delta
MSINSESVTIANGFIQYLVNSGKKHLLPEIIQVLGKELGPKLPDLIVESSIALSDADKNSIAGLLADKERAGEIIYRVNPSLIGGLKIIHGDRVLDMSVQNKLKKIYA